MSNSRLTLMGIESYLSPDKSLFDNILLPEDIEKEDLVNNILLRSGEFELLYTNPTFLAEVIRLWFRTHNRTFTKWITALNVEYNPLENYDRIEEWTDDSTGTIENTSTGQDSNTATSNTSDTTTNSGSSTVDVDASNSVDSNTTTSRSAYDSNVFVNDTMTEVSTDTTDKSKTETVSSGSATGSSDSTVTSSGTSSNTANQSSTSQNVRKGRAHGNIGVTTSQQMLESELDIAKWNIIEQITDLFVSEFCIMVY